MGCHAYKVKAKAANETICNDFSEGLGSMYEEKDSVEPSSECSELGDTLSVEILSIAA